MKVKNIVILIVVTFIYSLGFSQSVYDYEFAKKFTINATDSLNSPYQMPWVGGMNSMHFSEIDLDLDGTMDLFAFDKSANKVLTFINQGIPDSICYVYDDYYQKYFPEFYGWAHLLDYNQDQKMDIFTYTSAGIKVYKNISDTILRFQLLYPIINSDMGSSSSNICVTYDDYPAFFDIDKDGDIDILAFSLLGGIIQMHKNLSQELYNNSDTLLYELTEQCWGKIKESATNSHIDLNFDCPWKCKDSPEEKSNRHVGSTMLCENFNGDSLTDLILGDVDYFNLTKLINGGTVDTAVITSTDTLFPSLSHPINLNSFPVISYFDLNNDSLNDLLASPFTSNIYIPENLNSVWYYKNTGNSLIPQFTFIEPNFLQSKMIDFGAGAYPVIIDINSDGLKDIIVGNYGYIDSTYFEFGSLKSKSRSQIAILKNTGTATNPSFQILTKDFAGLSQYKLQGLMPTFGDIDNDGDTDMICGNSDGSLIYLENIGGPPGTLPLYNAPQFDYQGINAGLFSAPQLFDLNSDTLLDLIIGKQNGYLTYYQNTGTASAPIFTKITDSLGKVNVVDYSVSSYGYSTPCFFKDSGVIKLFVGSEIGKIYYYKDIAANLSGKFTAVDSILVFVDKDSAALIIKDGIRTGITVTDFDNNGYQDMVVGNFSGGLNYYNGVKPNSFIGINESFVPDPINFNIYPNPVTDKLFIKIASDNTSAVNVEIFDVVGRRILQKDFRNFANIELDMRNYNPGFYFCSLKTIGKKGKVQQAGTKKFIISK